jgi:hypothetical protein
MGSKPDTLRACHLGLVGDTWVAVAAVVMTVVVTVVVPIVAEVAAVVISIKGLGVVVWPWRGDHAELQHHPQTGSRAADSSCPSRMR